MTVNISLNVLIELALPQHDGAKWPAILEYCKARGAAETNRIYMVELPCGGLAVTFI